jgi:O-6-methylguanine DNA methyltransferase
MDFADRVRKAVGNIPEGKTLTYGEVARLVGSPGAARAVGNVLKNNYDPGVPCHRVVRQDGVGGYNRGQKEKIRKLTEEGVLPS